MTAITLKAFVSLWCTNEQAKEARGTSIPGCIKCPYWEAKVSHIPKQEEMTKHFEWFNNLTKGEKETLVYHIYSNKPYVYQQGFHDKVRIAYDLLHLHIR